MLPKKKQRVKREVEGGRERVDTDCARVCFEFGASLEYAIFRTAHIYRVCVVACTLRTLPCTNAHTPGFFVLFSRRIVQ